MTIEALTESSSTAPLRLLEPPARLRIPLGTRTPMEIPSGVVIGANVVRGQALAEAAVEGGPAALAPVSGRIVGVSQITLTNGQVVPAVELSFAPFGSASARDAVAVFESVEPL